MVDEIRQLSALIADIYDAALIQAAWPDILSKVSGFVGGASVNFFSQKSSNRATTLHFQWGNDAHYEQLYLQEYYKLNPLVPAISFVDAGTVFSQSDPSPTRSSKRRASIRSGSLPRVMSTSLAPIWKSRQRLGYAGRAAKSGPGAC